MAVGRKRNLRQNRISLRDPTPPEAFVNSHSLSGGRTNKRTDGRDGRKKRAPHASHARILARARACCLSLSLSAATTAVLQMMVYRSMLSRTKLSGEGQREYVRQGRTELLVQTHRFDACFGNGRNCVECVSRFHSAKQSGVFLK